MLPLYVKRRCLNLAKRMSPIDTGNLRFNAIRGKKWLDKNEFTISYDSTTAPYLEILQDSVYRGRPMRKRNKHHGFINLTVFEITNVLLAHFERGENITRNDYTNRVRDYQADDNFSMNRRMNRYLRGIDTQQMIREVNENGSTTSI